MNNHLTPTIGSYLGTSNREVAENDRKRFINRVEHFVKTYDEFEDPDRDIIHRYLDTYRAFDNRIAHYRYTSRARRKPR